MRVQLDTSELGALAARLRRLEDDQRTDLLAQLGDELMDETRYRLRISEAAPDGTPWRALAPSYARRTADPTDFLQDTGRMLESIEAAIAADHVEVGSPLRYAAVHQRGSRHVPARPYLGIGEDDADELELIAARYLAAAIEGQS